MSIARGEYKGYPTLIITDDEATDERGALTFSFGLKKASLIVRHFEEIRAFVNENNAGKNKKEA